MQSLPLAPALQINLRAALDEGLQDGEVAALLTLCPNLEVLDMVAAFRIEPTYVMQVIDCAIENPPLSSVIDGRDKMPGLPFQCLRELVLQHWDTECCTDLSSVWTAFMLPGLETFRGHMMYCDVECESPLPYNSSELKRAYFTSSISDASGISTFLKVCPKVETPSIDWGGVSVGEGEVWYDEIGGVLRTQGRTLQTLVLDPREVYFFEDGQDIVHHPIKDLGEFNSLKHLSVP